ncbi:hypothetical protein INR49_011947 [Caranx melampygus]|nr:hypothetical protein INR49_011947 [Caranx melampygus]
MYWIVAAAVDSSKGSDSELHVKDSEGQRPLRVQWGAESPSSKSLSSLCSEDHCQCASTQEAATMSSLKEICSGLPLDPLPQNGAETPASPTLQSGPRT